MTAFYAGVAELARSLGLEQKSSVHLVRWVMAELALEAMDGPVFVPGFGTFRKSTTKARRVRNPSTGALMKLPASWRLSFSASKFQKGAR